MRILAIKRDKSGCNYYRVENPLTWLRDKGMAEVIFLEAGPDFMSKEAEANLLFADIVVFHRPAEENYLDFIKSCQEAGKIIVVDYDDDPFNTSPWNPYYRNIGVKEFEYKWPDTGIEQWLWKDGMFGFDIERNIQRRDMFRACFKKADAVTVTSDILKEQLQEVNPNCHVLPNLLDLNFYPKCELVKDGKIRIGWQGGYSHYEDIWMIKDQIAKVLKENPNVVFVYMGDPKFDGVFRDLPEGQYEKYFWVSHAVYPYKLKMLNLDIGICPLVDNEFNRRKSSIKHFEFNAVGAATVCSDVPPYSIDAKHNETTLLVKPDGWVEALNELIKDPIKRARLQKNAYEDIYENYNIEKKVHMWKDVYEGLLKKELTEDELHIQRSTSKA